MGLIRVGLRYLLVLVFTSSFNGVSGQYHVKPLDISKKITALQQSEDGYLFYGTKNGEFGLYDGLQFYRLEDLDAHIRSISTEEGVIFLETSKGLYELEKIRIKQLSRNNLDVLARSLDNSFLVTTSGVYLKSNAEYAPSKEDFFDINEIQFGSFFNVGDLEYFRADKNLYVKKNRWRSALIHSEGDYDIIPWNSSKMMIADRKALFSFDNDGYVDTLLHLQTERPNRIFKLSGSNLLLCSSDSVGVFNVRKRELTNFYRLPTGLITCATEDDWGNIWIAAGSYIYQIIDRSNDGRNQPPNIKIKSIRINGIKNEVKESFHLDKDVNDIEIEYSGVHLTYPQNLEFQSLLTVKQSSLDNNYNTTQQGEWSSATKSRRVEYRDLEPGKYSFQLRGTVDGEYFMYTKPIVFTVESNVVQSIWLVGFLGAVGILMIALFFNSRYNSLKQKSEQERRRLIQENKMLTLQQKALQLQMNPHFVFNSLNSIQGLIAKEDNQKARRYLQEFSTMMRSVLNQSREETILLSEEIKYLKSYLHLEQMANNDKFDWEVFIDPELEDDIRIPTMIIQPFVENAILHGVRTLKDRRGKIQLNFEMNGTKICCKVVDNGIGREAAAALKKSSHKSVAIEVVKERLTSKLKSAKTSPIQYSDVLNVENKVIGTEVVLFIPITN
ncbi:MAG: histidine kinase [Bacteroidota bacterium]